MSIDSLVVQCQCQLKWSIIVLNECLGLQYRLQWPHLPTMTNDNDNDNGPSHELKAIWGNGLGLTSPLWKSPRIVVWHQHEQHRVNYSDQRKYRGILWVTAKSWKRDYVRWLSELPLAYKIKAVKFTRDVHPRCHLRIPAMKDDILEHFRIESKTDHFYLFARKL